MTRAKRQALNRHLWALVRQLPGGQQTLRDMVALIHDEDETCQDLNGTDDYTSTRRLTDKQFARLVDMVAERAQWPSRPGRVLDGSVVWMIKARERSYIQLLADYLQWNQETLEKFVLRQIKGKRISTHKQADAVIMGMERMLIAKGWVLRKDKGRKAWIRPEEETCQQPT